MTQKFLCIGKFALFVVNSWRKLKVYVNKTELIIFHIKKKLKIFVFKNLILKKQYLPIKFYFLKFKTNHITACSIFA